MIYAILFRFFNLLGMALSFGSVFLSAVEPSDRLVRSTAGGVCECTRKQGDISDILASDQRDSNVLC